jgi:prepilin-type N-terminal cleavage/methylation domain-containing protein
MKEKQKGFTLIELLVVITIIAILAIAITVGYQSVRDSARDAKRIEIARSIATAQELYYNKHGHYAKTEGEPRYVVPKLLEEGFLSSNPADAKVSPNFNEPDSYSLWLKDFWVRGSWPQYGDRFAVRVANYGDDFCCTQNGCREIDHWNNCHERMDE